MRLLSSLWILPCGVISQVIGLGVALARDAKDREFQRAGKLATGPVERIEASTSADVFACHLPHDDFGVRVDAQGLSFHREGDL